MRLSSFLAPALLALAASETAEAARDSVLLSKIKSLTLRNGQKTTARRVSPIPQLKCIGGDAKGLYEVDVMRCKNAGSDYDDDNIQWTCQASLPEEFKLGSTDVICEGYDSPDDPYILKGSCGVEYRLMLTPKGLDRYGHRKGGRSGSGEDDQISQGIAILFWVVFFGVIIWMVFKACIVGGGDAGDPNTWTGPRGGGGGWGGNDDPPPPYTPRPPYDRKSYPSNNTGNQGWRPGFWSGALGGAAAGYMAGNRGNRGGYSTFPRGGNSWGNDAGEGPSGSYQRPSSPSNTRYESTGFGETRRR
ncbi:Store-operated calcium entry-associated regulatory factor [Lasiodiplodia theobromae]|uniref:Store-operated calcium entry-associated regulatory factor n=1 Tax=Lasiodiplodia theobromae TaxID=45133 RepID=A0A5N5DJ32_9PEZI|nr:Store-operated calcium entry-associated regulatory factor [Lasiodiplodia theobromae]